MAATAQESGFLSNVHLMTSISPFISFNGTGYSIDVVGLVVTDNEWPEFSVVAGITMISTGEWKLSRLIFTYYFEPDAGEFLGLVDTTRSLYISGGPMFYTDKTYYGPWTVYTAIDVQCGFLFMAADDIFGSFGDLYVTANGWLTGPHPYIGIDYGIQIGLQLLLP